MQEELKVALVQANQIWEDKQANFAQYTEMISDVEADLFLCPEMFHTGFSMNATVLAEDWETSEGMVYLKQIAQQKNSACYTSLIIKENNQYRNRAVFVEPNGSVTYYDKRKTFGLAGEDKIYTPGTEQVVKEYKGWRFLLQICYDLRFPEIQLNHLQDNRPLYDVLLTIANWPERRNVHWKALLPARAIENQAYVCATNRVGKDATDLIYSGDSTIIDALGNHLVSASYEACVLTTTLSASKLQEARQKLPFLKDRSL